MSEGKDPLGEALASHHPLIYVHSSEEDRVVDRLRDLSDAPVYSWTCTLGFDDEVGGAEDTRDPVAAVQAAIGHGGPGLFVMKDLSAYLDRPEVARVLRDAYYGLSEKESVAIVILSPDLRIPTSLEKNISLVRVQPPGLAELRRLVLQVLSRYQDQALPGDWVADFALSLNGLTLDEAKYLLHRVLSSGHVDRQRLVEAVNGAKRAAVMGSTLEYVSHDLDLGGVGGLSALKEWIRKRTPIFRNSTLDAGLPAPRGILLMGISGCGKSLCAKVAAGTWRVPLFRLDMNSIHSGASGTPEAAFGKALEAIGSVAPAVLWIDEIENGLGIASDHGQTAARIFSTFLTWMQEKPPLVFVAATANRIEALPAEMIRKGRFDQVFFCDLPTEEERREVFEIHLRRNQAEPADFDLERLVAETRDWNAAEIEQAVIAGRIDAAAEGSPLGPEHVLDQIRNMVPLSKTMHEQIKFIRDWAWDRATPASGGQSLTLE